ncbi:hypothetical protein [Alteromonas sp. a30]|uniref:hypothetical protein n=1 Tax=Alteromonas sp. a30 TaxID=2730917 RepID=UPI00227E2E43|nr:hypothetical protein [Alteromonas sp. a30]MCY7297336.1 hypothetical protein [Alteromonas sp. a30]
MIKFILCVSLSLLPMVAFSVQDVSIFRLIVEPEKYENKTVRVKGYLDIAVDTALFVNEDFARMNDIPSSIPVNDASQDASMTVSCYERNVSIVGVIRRSGNHFKIDSIQRVLELSQNKYCWIDTVVAPSKRPKDNG